MTDSSAPPLPEYDLPADDRSVSPNTGYTRAHWEAIADRLLDGAARYSSPSGALIDFPSPEPATKPTGLEGFARTFLLAAIRIAGDDGRDRALIERYRKALDAGVDPNGPETWPALTDHSGPTVEAAAIAVGLQIARPWLWDGLDRRTRTRMIDWFSGEKGCWCADNNHVLLGATIAAFVESAGGEVRRGEVDQALDRMEDWYVGDGWYSDGEGRRFDHYNAWTFHFYPFFICQLAGARLDGRRAVYRERLRMFLGGYQHLFGADGAPLIQGRSLTYRWGVAAPFWMAHLEGVDALSAGRTRRLCSGVVKYFLDAGVGADGTLGLGWFGDDGGILQSYNVAGSPHWASKGFLGLLLPADHEVWTAPEEPLEIEEGDVRRVLSGPQWTVDGWHGVARVHNFGSDGHPHKDDGLYRRLAFSTGTAPVLHGAVRDNDLTVPGPNVRHLGLQRGTASQGGGRLARRIDAAGRDVHVDYAVRIMAGYELRAARVSGVIGLPLRMTGYAVASSTAPDADVSSEGIAAEPVAVESVAAAARTSCQSSDIRWLASDVPLDVRAEVFRPERGNALGTECAVPGLQIDRCPVNEVTILWAVALDGVMPGGIPGVPGTAEIRCDLGGACVRVDGHDVVLRWARGPRWPAETVNQGVFLAVPDGE